MKTLFLLLFTLTVTITVNAQVPNGTIPACGTAPGYYQPQPYTLKNLRKVPVTNGTYYATSGNNQQYWNQYTPNNNGTGGTYGPREPNPFSQNGNLSYPRAVRHVVTTRILRPTQKMSPGSGRRFN